MSQGLRELLDQDLDAELELLLAPKLTSTLLSRQDGHCARVTEIPGPLATELCQRIRSAAGDRAQAYVLGAPPEVPQTVAVTSTKLIELRNPDADRLRPPMLVFVPPGTRASAEDSFDVATFEEIRFGDVYADLVSRLLQEFPDELRRGVDELLSVLDEEGGSHAGTYQRARYLLTVKLNDHDADAAGAAVFELGLVPDFELFQDMAAVRTRAVRNIQQMKLLTDADRPARQRVIALGLTDPTFRKRLADFLVRHGVDEPREWTRRVVVDQANWPLAFQRWPLPDERVSDDRITILVKELNLPKAGSSPDHAADPVLSTITGQPFLLGGPKGMAQLPVEFEVDPDPRGVPGLKKFTVQLISEKGGPTGVVTSTRVSTTAKRRYKTSLKKLRAADLEEGWHFLRVLPLDDEGVPLPVTPVHEGTVPAHESERFYVSTNEEIEDPAPSTKTDKEEGVTQALRKLQFQALAAGRSWTDVACREVAWKHSNAALQASFGAYTRVEIPLSSVLAKAERSILANPDHSGRTRLQIHSGMADSMAAEEQSWPPTAGEPLVRFLSARTEVFTAIRGDEDVIVEGRDITGLRELITEYAEAYEELLNRQLLRIERADDDEAAERLRELAGLLQIDTIAIDHVDGHGDRTEVTLVSPTHPVRLLWLATWAELGHQWLKAAHGADAAVIAAATRSYETMRPLGFPLTVPRSGGQMAVAAGDLNAFWGVLLPTGTSDPSGLLSSVRAALGTPKDATDAGAVSGTRLADRVERYLRLHPYVRTLAISAVNAGDASPLADMLLDLQRRKALKDTSYEVRLFAPDPEAHTEGAALAQLLRGQWRDTADAEAFHTRQAAGIRPKLAVAVRPLDEFRSASTEYNSHITFLFDAFSSEEFGTVEATGSGMIPVHGLLQDVTVSYEEDDQNATWHKTPRHGQPHPLAQAEELTDLLASLPEVISHGVSAVATGQAGTRLVPSITLSLGADDTTLLHQAHQSSDWVIAVDRTLGVEYFDNPLSSRRSDYVIDFEGDSADGLGHHIVITSRSVDELCALLTPVVTQHGLTVDQRHTQTFFDQLRLLSGRLAFKIASAAPTQRTEVLGLALARLFLDDQGVLENQILVPLDSHLELYQDARRRADFVGDAVSLQRTDLALFSLDARQRKIMCRLVEVKCYSAVPVAVYDDLKAKMAGQLDRSASVLTEHFDPHRTQPDRPDRVVKNAELASLLSTYLERAVRHNTMSAKAAAEARWMLERLDNAPGYRLEFTRTGIIFDLSGNGISSEIDGGVEFHLVGRDVANKLITAIPTSPPPPAADATEPSLSSLVSMESTVPRLVQAGFRAPDRVHDLPGEENTGESAPVNDRSREEESPATEVAASPALFPSEASGTSATRTLQTGEPATPEPAAEPIDVPGSLVAPSDAEPVTAADVEPLSDGEAARGQGATPNATSAQAWLPDIYLGSIRPSPQFGILGETAGKKIALDLNETHTISLFGVQGGGKSYTLGTIIEAASLPRPPANELPHPLATIVFHYSPTLDYAPEFTSMVQPNSDEDQVAMLRERYGVEPAGLSDVVMLVPEDQLDQRRSEYPAIHVLPLKFGSAELRAEHWRFLMGAIGNQSTYIRQLQRIMKANRNDLRLDVIRDGIDASPLSDNLKQLAHQRLDLASDYIDDQARIKPLVQPGRVIIVDLRDEFIEKDEALGLFVVLMQLFAEAQKDGERFNKLVVFDEAHKYIESPDLVAGLVENVREMRHKGMSVLVASQDPPSVPISLIELSNHVILHKFTSPAWLKHLQKANASLTELTSAKMANLAQGEAYVWSSKATDNVFTARATKVRLRPRITLHGGATKTAVSNQRK